MPRELHVVSALIEKRARVAGELQAAQFLVMRIKGDLAAIDGCIRMFKDGFDPATIPAKVTFEKSPANLAKGVGSRKALEILRVTGESLSAQDLARRVLILLDKETDQRSVRALTVTIHSSFSRQKNPVVTLDRSTWPGTWRIIPL